MSDDNWKKKAEDAGWISPELHGDLLNKVFEQAEYMIEALRLELEVRESRLDNMDASLAYLKKELKG